MSKLWENGDPVAIVAGTIVLSFVGLGFLSFGCRAIINHQNLFDIFFAIAVSFVGLSCLVMLVGILRYKWQELGPALKEKMQTRSLPKTVVEMEQFPLIIGEQNRFFIRQYCKKTDEFFGCKADISLALEETEEYYAPNGRPEYSETRQRAECFVHGHKFDNENENARYELLFTALLPVEDYVPTTRARFLTASLQYEWYLRVRIYSEKGTLLSRDFPVVLSHR
jgi:hypothetical protein